MNARFALMLASLVVVAPLTGCGGGAGSGGASLPGGNGTQSAKQLTEASIDTANAFGSPVRDFSSYNESTSSPVQTLLRKGSVSAKLSSDGSCQNGVEFFSPDKNGDPNSSELINFYDSACTQMARDAVRIWTSTSSSAETVQRTVNFYALNQTAPDAVRSENVAFSNASFDQYGYPVVSNGFDRTYADKLSVGSVKTIDSDGELVVEPSTGSSTTYCGDSAGFNATGNQYLDETFGWAGVAPTGTRTVNNDGSVTWSTTHTGTAYTGAIGALAVQDGVQNTSCPITTPMFTLTGGTAKGQYTIPISATFSLGILTSLSVQNATLPSGDSLNVQTNSNVPPSNSDFISGTVSSGGTTIASFDVNAFGDGVLVVAATGNSYQILDWQVAK